MTPLPSSFDRSYHGRHGRRAGKKAKLLMGRINPRSTIVDIGCNAGLISKALLAHGTASHATGIEVDGSIIDPELRNDPEFDLIEGEVQRITLPRVFDYGIYFAVHHHIVAHHGLETAVRTLRHIASHCRSDLFFETGKISESSYWPWQEGLRKHFRFDEEHYAYIFSCLEDLLESFEIVGYNAIHGIRREIFRLKMRSEQGRMAARSALSMREANIATGTDPASETMHENALTKIERIEDQRGQPFILKTHKNNPLAAMREHLISTSIEGSWGVKSLGLVGDSGLIFPLVVNRPLELSEVERPDRSQSRMLARQLTAIRHDLLSQRLFLSEPYRSEAIECIPYQVCDLNPSNILITSQKDANADLRVVDFAYQSRDYRWKNELNFCQAFKRLGERPFFRAYLLMSGYCLLTTQLLRNQFAGRIRRIHGRMPSLLGALWCDLANNLGKRFR